MEIIKVATYANGMTEEKEDAELQKRGLERLTNKEHDEILNGKDAEKYKDYYPCRTATHIKYAKGATEAEIWNEGQKPEKIYLPLDDGWYLPEVKFGIPNGEKSSYENSKARKLWRWQNEDFEGLVARGYDYFYFIDCRDVGCGCRHGGRFGVLAKPKAEHKHKWRKVCIDCGVEQ